MICELCERSLVGGPYRSSYIKPSSDPKSSRFSYLLWRMRQYPIYNRLKSTISTGLKVLLGCAVLIAAVYLFTIIFKVFSFLGNMEYKWFHISEDTCPIDKFMMPFMTAVLSFIVCILAFLLAFEIGKFISDKISDKFN